MDSWLRFLDDSGWAREQRTTLVSILSSYFIYSFTFPLFFFRFPRRYFARTYVLFFSLKSYVFRFIFSSCFCLSFAILFIIMFPVPLFLLVFPFFYHLSSLSLLFANRSFSLLLPIPLFLLLFLFSYYHLPLFSSLVISFSLFLLFLSSYYSFYFLIIICHLSSFC